MAGHLKYCLFNRPIIDEKRPEFDKKQTDCKFEVSVFVVNDTVYNYYFHFFAWQVFRMR